ncbi:UNVERIFIED_CONTAM: Dol-P-Man:Man(7)GlcNAc(2)-PP-Dol alpha-1,6-mannosyltransferase [Sesamum latifolium]|uniref:Mannosyltransferase n=1 Tax=Sesamum latifolium TaxID=2727402 RepID=A0AAW2YFZ5_9LAMI
MALSSKFMQLYGSAVNVHGNPLDEKTPKIYENLHAVLNCNARLVLGCIILSTLRFFRIQIRKNFGSQVEVFFVILTALQFHMLFYCTRLPNILAFGLDTFFSLVLHISTSPFLAGSISALCGRLTDNSKEVWVHIDTFSAMNGISRFCENNEPWRYSKEEGIPLQEFQGRNFTYLLRQPGYVKLNTDSFLQVNMFSSIVTSAYFSIKGFSGARLHAGFPPISLVKTPKVYVHGNCKRGNNPSNLARMLVFLIEESPPPLHLPPPLGTTYPMVSSSRDLYSFSLSNPFNTFSNSNTMESAGVRRHQEPRKV